MNQLNNILLEGNVATNPEVVATSLSTGQRLVKLVIANSRTVRETGGGQREDTLFINVQCWGQLGEGCLEKIRKGMSIRCVGRLASSRWEDRNGNRRQSFEIVASHIEYRPFDKGRCGEVEILDDKKKEADSVSEVTVFYEF